MKVDHAAAKVALKESGGKSPDHPGVKISLGDIDEWGQCELVIDGDPHARVESVARSLRILEASTPPPTPILIDPPSIWGKPNIEASVVGHPGAWEEDPDLDKSAVSTLEWIYADDDSTVVIPDGTTDGREAIVLPPESFGRSIVFRVTRGTVVAVSDPFGPIEGGLTVWEPVGQPVRDSEVISAEPKKKTVMTAAQKAAKAAKAKASRAAKKAKSDA